MFSILRSAIRIYHELAVMTRQKPFARLTMIRGGAKYPEKSPSLACVGLAVSTANRSRKNRQHTSRCLSPSNAHDQSIHTHLGIGQYLPGKGVQSSHPSATLKQ